MTAGMTAALQPQERPHERNPIQGDKRCPPPSRFRTSLAALGRWGWSPVYYNPELTADQILDIQYRVFNLRAGSPIQISSLFISYTHGDCAFVDAIEEKLNAGGIRFWRDIHDAPAGPLDSIVDRAIRLNPTMLLVLSKNSVKSDWVEDEATRARELEKELGRPVLCPVALDDAWKQCTWSNKLRTQIEKYNILPFHDWEDPKPFEGMFRRLVQGLAIFYRPEKPAR